MDTHAAHLFAHRCVAEGKATGALTSRGRPAAAPLLAIRKQVPLNRLREHLSRETGGRWRKITSVANPYGVDEVLMKMIDELDRTILHRPTDGDVVGHGQMLHQLT